MADAWFGIETPQEFFPRGLQKLPLVLAFVRKPSADNMETLMLKDTFLMKTMHFLAEDYAGVVNFAFVAINADHDLITQTYNVDYHSLEN